ncbi:MAG: DUF4130 domain-containing protein [Parafannyhessea sp.]|uniref:DUF4130 domain-containing protein n=1 Tax=Parafannyhessea sp. TaxID=2847324 RepID=UPI003EFD9D9D
MGYLARASERTLRLCRAEAAQPALDESLVTVPDVSLDGTVAFASRVYRGFERRVSAGCPLKRSGSCPANCKASCATRLALAAANDGDDVPEAVHAYMRLGFEVGPKIRNMLSDARVASLDSLARYTLTECEHTRQFARFSLLADGSYFCSFRPKADTLPLACGYFAARMRDERFCMIDPKHLTVVLHERGQRRCSVSKVDRRLCDEIAAASDQTAAGEKYVHAMWRRFYDSVGLDGRDASQRGYDLRAKWMPKRFWDGLVELSPEALDPGDAIPAAYAARDKKAALPHHGQGKADSQLNL